ncbi:expressed unknown protein [Seminavis robusta]|uniref:Uncharacterized protein n=1 Tax=Seminavis robusta TaxID=568900 RepID=A0A9N8HSR5_9STRA|nr:expressed unknown protein [Seminavis robusta]|eukprot:Sro1554_g282040.1 n/a (459) ;mRNA; f:15801-17177
MADSISSRIDDDDEEEGHWTEEEDDDDSTTEMLSPALAVFLQSLLKDASTVNVVIDNLRGLPEYRAASFIPPPAPRISDSSVPELCRHRWGAESYCGADHSRRQLGSLAEDGSGSTAMDDSLDTSLTRAPLVPRRRTSIDSLEQQEGGTSSNNDVDDMMWTSDTDDDEDEWCTRGYSEDEDEDDDSGDEEESFNHKLSPTPPRRWHARVDVLKGTLLSELDQRDCSRRHSHSAPATTTTTCSNSSNKCIRSPPKAPERQASLRRLECSASDLIPTNLSLPSEDQLDCDVQKVARRRYGVSFLHVQSDPLTSMLTSPQGDEYRPSLLKENPVLVLEKIHREVCISAEDFEDDHEDEQQKQDNVARARLCRRNSDQEDILDRSSSSSSRSSLQRRSSKQKSSSRDSMPSCAKRRPSPQLEKSSFSDCDSADASPVRAKRRPSPEFESFEALVNALAKVKQ